MGIDAWLQLILANFLASVVPGQNVVLVAGATSRGGLRAGGATLCGILLADAAWSAIALLAVVGLLDIGQVAIEPLRALGGALLLLIGLGVLRTREVGDGPAPLRVGGALRDDATLGALVGFANPMALVFFVAVLPQFVPADALAPADAALCLIAVLLSSALALAPYLLASSAVFAGRPSRLLRGACGVLLALFGGLAVADATVWRRAASPPAEGASRSVASRVEDRDLRSWREAPRAAAESRGSPPTRDLRLVGWGRG